jgi:heptosyltransferase-2
MAQKIIVRAPNHLGDCVMALPMINETREAHPGSTVTVLAPEPLAGMFEGNLAIDHVLKIPSEHVHGLIGVFKIKDIIAPHDFDLGYVLPPSFGAASGFKLAGVKERIGYVTDGRRLLLSKPLPLPEPVSSAHRSETYFNLLRRGSGIALDFVDPKLFVSEQELEAAGEMLVRHGLKAEGDFAALSVRAVAESRRWGLDNYISLIKVLISRHGLQIVLIGSGDDRADGEEVINSTGSREVINLAGKTSLRKSAAILARSSVFIGNDSGPAHLAAAVGCDVVVLSGADNPTETSPIARRKRLIFLDHLDCISCVKNHCPLKGDERMQCMRGISVEMVAAEVAGLLRQV